jgi:phage N-6-adenine-methyltransferase
VSGFKHEPHYEGITNDWITPRYIIDALGTFDLDPCASVTQPWSCARKAYTIEQDGLGHDWFGRVWLNPPYGHLTTKWIQKLAKHGNGIALVFGRTDTNLWHDDIFRTADGFLFIRGRVKFYKPDGSLHPGGNAGAPSVLIAWGNKNRDKLIAVTESGKIAGAFLDRAFYTMDLQTATEQQSAMVLNVQTR